MKKTLGGDRIGSGKKMQVDLHGYNRSTHDLGYLWRSTMSAGTLVPFLSMPGLPGDSFDIDLDAYINTHPTVGPLFGSYKVQLDIYEAPVRLYQAQLHNNKIGIGLNMAAIKLPLITLTGDEVPATHTDPDNAQINPSCLHAYLGIRGVGQIDPGAANGTRTFNGIPLLAYWDIYKNYYANKQEEIGAYIHADLNALVQTVDDILINGSIVLSQMPANDNQQLVTGDTLTVDWTGTDTPPEQIMIYVDGLPIALSDLAGVNSVTTGSATTYTYTGINNLWLSGWDYIEADQIIPGQPQVVTFPLENLDKMRENILAAILTPTAFNINTSGGGAGLAPYSPPITWTNGRNPMLSTQEGLGVKTYNSDLFNNWLRTEYIDGVGGINDITSIDTSGGSFEINTLLISKKVYDMLNRIAVSGGTYDDWMDANWMNDRVQRAETPIYHGGLIKELIFQEVISNSESVDQPLGTLAGKGTLSSKHKGGKITIRVQEPSYIIGIISLTPRIDYSQGNQWDVHLKTMDDFHKPALDEIGFQELITEQMAWWSSYKNAGGTWTTKSAGKQPAWINYMTNYNKVYGNFAIQDNEMFMTLNRRYEMDTTTAQDIKDLTTYIDPTKYNNIFAETALDAQNFWAQISVDITGRRVMSAKLMPNL